MSDLKQAEFRHHLYTGSRKGPCAYIVRVLRPYHYSSYMKCGAKMQKLFKSDFLVKKLRARVDILDTSGDIQFPAMRRLCIANAHAFLVTYSINNSQSFDTVRQCIEEIKEQRTDYEDIPMVIAGNKMDLEVQREVFKEDVTEWIYREMQSARCRVIECSARENLHVKDIFRTFLQIGRVPQGEDTSLKRQSSAYSKNRSQRRSASPQPQQYQESIIESAGASGLTTPPSAFSRNKPRSRSLIRRSSKKAKQHVKDAHPDDCTLS
ncbi:unnamed protein product, partial [Meganyctiphanes norvegica]